MSIHKRKLVVFAISGSVAVLCAIGGLFEAMRGGIGFPAGMAMYGFLLAASASGGAAIAATPASKARTRGLLATTIVFVAAAAGIIVKLIRSKS